jgi:hypothetical protein
MKRIDNEENHGVVRLCRNVDVEESTWLNGRKHGLSRSISDKEVTVAFWRNGLRVSHFKFRWNFSEAERSDLSGILKDLSPANFKPVPTGFTNLSKRVARKRKAELDSTDSTYLSVVQMLKTAPGSADVKATALWRLLKTLPMKLLLTFWDMVEPKDSGQPLTDPVSAVFVRWGDDEGTHTGMRAKSGNKQGIVRSVDKDGFIIEATYKNNQLHGIQRFILDDRVRVSIFREGRKVAYLHMDKDLNETSRGGPEEDLFLDLTSKDF